MNVDETKDTEFFAVQIIISYIITDDHGFFFLLIHIDSQHLEVVEEAVLGLSTPFRLGEENPGSEILHVLQTPRHCCAVWRRLEK